MLNNFVPIRVYYAIPSKYMLTACIHGNPYPWRGLSACFLAMCLHVRVWLPYLSPEGPPRDACQGILPARLSRCYGSVQSPELDTDSQTFRHIPIRHPLSHFELFSGTSQLK
jgi:hypothetical protein